MTTQADHAAALKAAMEAVTIATNDYVACEIAERDADREKWRAKERLNKAQQVLDTLLTNIKKEAPHDTRWHQAERIPVRAE